MSKHADVSTLHTERKTEREREIDDFTSELNSTTSIYGSVNCGMGDKLTCSMSGSQDDYAWGTQTSKRLLSSLDQGTRLAVTGALGLNSLSRRA